MLSGSNIPDPYFSVVVWYNLSLYEIHRSKYTQCAIGKVKYHLYNIELNSLHVSNEESSYDFFGRFFFDRNKYL